MNYFSPPAFAGIDSHRIANSMNQANPTIWFRPGNVPLEKDQPQNYQNRRNRLPGMHRRRGGAIVETACCIPLIILLMMGTLEVCSGIYLYESCKVAGFEGIRVGIRRGGTADDVIARTRQVLAERRVTLPETGIYGVSVEPSDFSQLKALDPITVTVTVPTEGNSVFLFDTFAKRVIRASVTMLREFDN
jgi:hypothetical protein